MASIIIASIALALTLLVYLYGGWRFLRFPRFWVTFARVDVTGDPERPIQYSCVNVAYRGGGQPRNVIDAGVIIRRGERLEFISGQSGWLREVIHVPAELGGRFTIELPGDLSLPDTEDELVCAIRLDCGREYFEIPFTLRKTDEDRWNYFSDSGSVLSSRFPRRRLKRLLDWIRSR